MDFELKTLTRTRICSEKCDALLVLIPQNLSSDDDPLSALAALAIKSGDFEAKPGKLLSAYRTPGIAATRILLVGAGDGSPKNVRIAVNAALGALKNSNAQRAVLCLSALNNPQPDAVRAAVVACGDAVYTYITTKSKASPAKLQRIVIAVNDAANARAGFDKGTALVKGIDFAKEWANRPGNHATPTQLAVAAKDLGKLS